MNTGDENIKRRRISALDVFIVVLVLMCIAGVIVRVLVGKDGVLSEGKPHMSEYVVSFEVSKARMSAGGYYTIGEALYTEDGKLFGTIRDQVRVTPAKIYIEDEEGKYVISYSGTENGDNSFVDIRGTITVEGYGADFGFLVGGETYIAPNYALPLHTDKTTAEIKIMNITPTGD